LLKSLEKRFAEKLKVNESNVVLCANATLAIQGLCELSPAEEFKVPSFTFAATGLAVQKSGKKLGLLDIVADSWEIDISQNKLDSSTGVVPVAPFGRTLNLDKYLGIENVIVDAAASLGSYLQSPVKLEKNHSIVFSLHATKVLGIGEGGLVLFGDASKAQEFRTWLNFGFSGSRDSSILGTNAKMSEMQAAYGHAVLDHWEQEKAEWGKARKRVEELEARHNLKSPTLLKGVISPYWIIQAEEALILEIESKFQDSNIQTRRWWSRGLHKMPAFKNYSTKEFPGTDQVASTTIGLPFFRDLGDEEIVALDSLLTQLLK
jgi:dTDP-4-amino-4,6-dideoxygalactose transaminase